MLGRLIFNLWGKVCGPQKGNLTFGGHADIRQPQKSDTEMDMLEQPLMTVHETAEMLKVKESTVRSWIREKKLRAIKFGREWRITVVDLETFLNENANK